MSHLIGNGIVELLTIVVSVLVLLYALGYSVMLFVQKNQGKTRWDWAISMIFYVGIILITVSHLLFFVLDIVGDFPAGVYLLALILFVWGFEKRAGASEKITKEMLTPPKAKKRK
ncbi:MAG: hypothetical protein Q8R15_03050 [Candidatus Micrarchaeota archaeon]|nr:hypothetical protein [Candidatus Micrarchaeota archaeon]